MHEFWTMLLALGSAAMLGGLVGLEREIHRRWAGLRTHMMVALGAAMFVQIGMALGPPSSADLSRIVQGVVVGIGFIGAGTILKHSNPMEIKGLTTASSVWMAAAVGTACGTNRYVLASLAALFAL